MHINFNHRKKEDDPFIQEMTALLWNEFSESQKRMLVDFIPEEITTENLLCIEIAPEEVLPLLLEEPKNPESEEGKKIS